MDSNNPNLNTATASNSSPVIRSLNDDPTSVYYLHNSDQPGIKLVIDVLSGDNYTAWSRAITMALRVKNKTAFIDGSIQTPAYESDLYEPWLRANSLVLSWLNNSISTDIRQSLVFVDSALELWENLKLRFAKSDGPRVFYLERSISGISQGSMSLIKYYNTFKTLWDEYINFRSIPKCVCGHCSCNIAKTFMESVLKFLVGLNDSYVHLRSQILMLSPMPTLAKVYSMLMQEEVQRGLNNSTGIDSAAMLNVNSENSVFLAKQPYGKDKKGKALLKCMHCGYSGHTIDKCYQVNGYPDWWIGPRGSRKLKDPQPKANMVLADSSGTSNAQLDTSFNPELYQQFLHFMNAQNSNNSNVSQLLS